jgi:outer membrane receptor protein involved in Fe transport
MENEAFYNRTTLKYIKCKQAALGLEYTNHKGFKFSTEAFHKDYSDYPFLLDDSISFANAMADYVALGHQKAEATGIGRAYGIEILIQQKLKKNFFWMSSYTYIVSEFKDKNDKWAPSSWDNKQFINLLFGKTFNKNWQLGLKWRYSGGTPYSPYDIAASADINTFQVTNRGIFNYDSLNTQRLPAFHQMDLRLDKHYFFKKCNLNLYLDIQNLYRSTIAFLPYLTVQRDEYMQAIVNPNDPNAYLVKIIGSDSGRMLPTIGFILEF